MNGTPYYTNSSHLPVGYTDDVFSALDIQDELQTLYTSGTVFHAFLGEKLPDWKAAANLVRKIAENYKLPYYTMSPTYSICRDHGYLTGEQPVCPVCGEPTEVYSRITGYYRPVQNWNDGKAQEYIDRKVYNIGLSTKPHTSPIVVSEVPETEADDHKADIAAESAEADDILLFKTATCPNCRTAIAMLDKAGVDYKVLNPNDERELVDKFDVKQAPTLVLVHGDSYEKYRGVSDIKGWLMTH